MMKLPLWIGSAPLSYTDAMEVASAALLRCHEVPAACSQQLTL